MFLFHSRIISSETLDEIYCLLKIMIISIIQSLAMFVLHLHRIHCLDSVIGNTDKYSMFPMVTCSLGVTYDRDNLCL